MTLLMRIFDCCFKFFGFCLCLAIFLGYGSSPSVLAGSAFQKHRVYIKSKPSAAVVYLDGKKLGNTPLSFKVNREHGREFRVTALPTQAQHFRQDVLIYRGYFPRKITFYMENPSEISLNDSDSGKNEDCANALAPVVYFETDSFEVSEGQKRAIECFVEALDLDCINTIKVFGYADERHVDEYNRQLALLRAKAVAAILESSEVPNHLIKTFTLGEVRIFRDASNAMPLDASRKVNFEMVLQCDDVAENNRAP